MTARPGGTTRQGPKFLTDFVSRHFIDQDGDGDDDEDEPSLRERLGSALGWGDGDADTGGDEDGGR
jgi:hypothetical protein